LPSRAALPTRSWPIRNSFQFHPDRDRHRARSGATCHRSRSAAKAHGWSNRRRAGAFMRGHPSRRGARPPRYIVGARGSSQRSRAGARARFLDAREAISGISPRGSRVVTESCRSGGPSNLRADPHPGRASCALSPWAGVATDARAGARLFKGLWGGGAKVACYRRAWRKIASPSNSLARGRPVFGGAARSRTETLRGLPFGNPARLSLRPYPDDVPGKARRLNSPPAKTAAFAPPDVGPMWASSAIADGLKNMRSWASPGWSAEARPAPAGAAQHGDGRRCS